MTKRASLVKNKVPIRTFTEWNDVVPGFFEIDTVSHSSSNASGKFLSTLNMTDIATGWTEPLPLFRKAALDVIDAMDKAVLMIPFPLVGIDFDNGSEFLNEELIKWSEKREITYTRSRPYKKNDQAWIEEKNGSVVRKHVGRERFEGRKTWRLLDQFYSVLRLYVNFFQPSQKLLLKHRDGAKVYKKHDEAKTPYQRVIESPHVSEERKVALRNQREQLCMVDTMAALTRLQGQLKKHAVEAPDPMVASLVAQRMAVHNFLQEETKRQEEHAPRGKPAQELRSALEALPAGTIVTAKDFLKIATRAQIDTCFHRFKDAGLLKKVSWGQYELLLEGGNTCLAETAAFAAITAHQV